MSVASLEPGTYLLLLYDYVSDVLERRGPFRDAHLEHARQASARAELVNVGAVGSPPTGAIFVFRDVGEAVLRSYAEADPYVSAGLVTGWRVQPWTVVV